MTDLGHHARRGWIGGAKVLMTVPELPRARASQVGTDLRDPPAILPVSIERGFRDAEARSSFRRTAESLQSIHDEALSESADRLAVADGVVLHVDLGIHVARAAENLRVILPQVWNINPLAGRHVGY